MKYKPVPFDVAATRARWMMQPAFAQAWAELREHDPIPEFPKREGREL